MATISTMATMATMGSEGSNAVFDSLAQMLQRPDDLDKIDELKTVVRQRKDTASGQLRIDRKAHSDNSEAGMESLGNSMQTLAKIEQGLSNMDQLCSQSQRMIENFETIDRIAETHENFGRVIQLREDIQSFKPRLDRVNELMAADRAKPKERPYILVIHSTLSALRFIHDSIMEQKKRRPDDVIQLLAIALPFETTLQGLFNELDQTVAAFETDLAKIWTNVLPHAEAGRFLLLTYLSLILRQEEKGDMAIKAELESQREYMLMDRRFRPTALSVRKPRQYKEQYFASIDAALVARFKIMTAKFEDRQELADILPWFFDDLERVKAKVVPVMPMLWDIFAVYCQSYHRALTTWLVSVIESEWVIERQLIQILNYEEDYREQMGQLGAPERAVSADLLDGRGAGLIAQYQRQIITGGDETIEKLIESERKGLLEQDESRIQKLSTGNLRTDFASQLWTILNTYIDLAKLVSFREVADRVADASCRLLFHYLQCRSKDVTDVFDRLVRESRLEITDEQVEDMLRTKQLYSLDTFYRFMTAIGNDQMVCIEDGTGSLDRYQHNCLQVVSDGHREHLKTQFQSIRNGFFDLCSLCASLMAKVVVQLNCGPSSIVPGYLPPEILNPTLNTIKENIRDDGSWHPDLAAMVTEEAATELLVAYLNNAATRKKKPNPEQDSATIFSESVVILDFFKERTSEKSYDLIEREWSATFYLTELVASEVYELVPKYQGLCNDFPDTSVDWVDRVLQTRVDYTDEMSLGIRQAARVHGSGTMMGRVKVASSEKKRRWR